MAKAALLDALKAAMIAAMPTRIVTRSFKDFSQRTSVELSNGVITLIAHGTNDYGGNLGRFGTPGRMPLVMTGQIQLAENSTPEDIENAELALLEEIENFCQQPPAPIGGLVLRSTRQSGQIEHPYGWIACELELLM